MAESTKSGQGKRKQDPKKYSKRMKCENKISIGMRGVLIFGASQESAARREAYNLLNEYADQLFGTEFLEAVLNRNVPKKLVVDYQHGTGEQVIVEHEEESKSEQEGDESEEEEDVEKAIAKEIYEIKKIKKSRRFQCVTTGVNAIIFVKSTLSNENLNKLVHFILSDLEKTKEKKARNFSRLVPVSHICRANIQPIRKIVTEIFLPELKGKKDDEAKTFCVNYKARFNNTLSRNEVLNGIASICMDSGHKVDLRHPDKVIIVEIMKGLCCMNMVDDFFKFKKYNIHEIVNDSKINTDESSEQKDTSFSAISENKKIEAAVSSTVSRVDSATKIEN